MGELIQYHELQEANNWTSRWMLKVSGKTNRVYPSLSGTVAAKNKPSSRQSVHCGGDLRGYSTCHVVTSAVSRSLQQSITSFCRSVVVCGLSSWLHHLAPPTSLMLQRLMAGSPPDRRPAQPSRATPHHASQSPIRPSSSQPSDSDITEISRHRCRAADSCRAIPTVSQTVCLSARHAGHQALYNAAVSLGGPPAH